jgi:Ca-activated chloride channel family protein
MFRFSASRVVILSALTGLTGCVGGFSALGTVTADASARDGVPKSEVVVNMDCFESFDREEARAYNKSAPSGGLFGRSGSAKGASSAGPPPMMAPPAPSPAMAPMAEEAEADDLGFAAPPPPSRPKPQKKKEIAAGAAEPAPMEPVDRVVQAGPTLDYGGETWLSNDDSMSLASAQRLLWAVDNHRSWTASQIRPHELLNYFSFDTETPKSGETFEVTASAEQDGDQLAVALAVQGANPPRQPLDLTMVVDRSCSMQDEGRMDYTKRGLNKMTEQLEKGDRIDVVLFDDRVCTPLENFVVGRDNPDLLKKVIDRMQPRGGTDMDLGLKEGYRVAKRKGGSIDRNRRVMAITDAFLNTGDVNHDTVSEIGKVADAEGIRLTGIGVGRDFNDDVLNKLTEKGKGAYVYLGSEAVVDRVFGSGFDGLVQTIAHDVRFKLDLPKSLALERFYGEEASTVKEDVQSIHYYAGTSQVFLQDLKIHPNGLDRGEKVKLEVEWRDTTGEPQHRVFHTTVGAMLDADPHNVRKAKTLMAFSDVLTARAMGADPCADPLATYTQRAGGVSGDAEIDYLDGLVEKVCPSWYGRVVAHQQTSEPVLLKVKVDSDIPIAEVAATCASTTHRDALSAADTVARLNVAPGSCRLTLQGAVPMTTTVEVAQTGSDIRCLVRGGRMQCS